MTPYQSPCILIVDDEPDVAQVLARALEKSGYDITLLSDPVEALEIAKLQRVDLLLTDYNMPGMKGDALQKSLRQHDPNVAVIMMTAESDVNLAINMLRDGVSDYVLKPFTLKDVVARVSKALAVRTILLERESLREQNEQYQTGLEEQLAEQTRRLQQTHRASLLALNRALEVKDETTRNHSERVSAVAREITRLLFPEDTLLISDVTEAALLHDIGKIGVREAVLQKTGPLTIDEFEEVKQHSLIGEQILRPIWNGDRKLKIVRHHHERWDGQGYPDNLRGEEIEIGARIVAVADTWDALTTSRPYRSAQGMRESLAVLREGRGSQWDAHVVDAAIKMFESDTLFRSAAA